MIETLVTFFQGLPPTGVLALTFGIAYIENLFPPSPSDVLLVFIGTIVGSMVVAMYLPIFKLAATI